MTEGIPASSSIAGRTILERGSGAVSARKTAVRTPMGTPSRIARVVPTMEVRMTYKMP